MDEAGGEKRARLSKAVKLLKKGRAPGASDEMTGSAVAALGDFEEACSRVDAAAGEYERRFEAALADVTTATREIVGDPRFREAVIWQNRQVLHTGMDGLLAASPGGEVKKDKLLRKREMLVANYWQRYCVKNDTVGFFGPVGWAKFVSEGEALGVRPGDSLLAARTVYFDGWCLDALAEELDRDGALLRWMAPRRVPAARLEGSTLDLPAREPLTFGRGGRGAARLRRRADGDAGRL